MRNPFRKRWALMFVRANGLTMEVGRYWLRSSAVMALGFIEPGMRDVGMLHPDARLQVVRSA